MKIVFMGTPDFAVEVLRQLSEKYEVVLVVSQPDRERKKGVLLPTPVKACALELGIPVHQPEKIGKDHEPLREANADVLVTAAYGQFVPSKVLNIFKNTINVHGSLLPKYRGGAPIQRAIMNGDKQTGITLIEMANKLDAGKMYAKVSYDILPQDTSSDVFEKLSFLGAQLLLAHIEDIVSGKNEGQEQDENLVVLAPNIVAEEEKLSFTKKSQEIVNHIHALAMTPGAYVNVHNIKVKVFDAEVVSFDSNDVPGTVLSIKKELLIRTLDGAIKITKILVPGKKIMHTRDFLNGQKIFNLGDVI